MRHGSYFRRIAGLVEGPTIRPPRLIFGSLPSVAEPAVISETRQAAPIQQPIAPTETEDLSGMAPSGTRRIEGIQPLLAKSKVQLEETVFETPSQPTPLKGYSVPPLRDEPTPATSRVFSASERAPVLPPSREDFRPAEWTVEASRPLRPPATPAAKDREMPTPLQPPLREAPARKKLPAPIPADSPRIPGIPVTSVSLKGRETAERTSLSQTMAREFEPPRRVVPAAFREGRNQGKDPAEHPSGAGGSVHIGSLEIKIAAAPPAPPPKPAPAPVPSAPAVPRRTISREFPTFGAAQAY